MPTWLPLGLALSYALMLFVVAWRTELRAARGAGASGPLTYAMSLAVYCTSWTFFGAVGTAATNGWNYLPIYLGPVLVLLLGNGFMRKLVMAAKQDGAISIADFISSRYGKDRRLAAVVTLLALLSALPYIALQLKSLGMTYNELVNSAPGQSAAAPEAGTVLLIAGVLALFAIVFGTRRYDAAGRNHGLVVAVAMESVVKVAALTIAGLFAVWLLWGAPAPARTAGLERLKDMFALSALSLDFPMICLLSMSAILCLPRQFHIAVVEATDPDHIRRARWTFPAYCALTAAVVVPITWAGLALLPSGAAPDLYVIDLPLLSGHTGIATLVFIGGFSAATAMVIVETLALATMVSNDILAPLILRSSAMTREHDIGRQLLIVRRLSIMAIVAAAYAYYRTVDSGETLAAIGLIAFAAAAQFAPAVVGAVVSAKCSTAAAGAGLVAGGLFWLYTLFLPSTLGVENMKAFLDPWRDWLDPHALFGLAGLSPITHGTIWSLGSNITIFLLLTYSRPLRRVVAGFVATRMPPSRFGFVRTVGDVRTLAARFVGHEVTNDAFSRLDTRSKALDAPLNGEAARCAERLIASVIGAPSARVIMSSAMTGASLGMADVVQLLDETSHSLQFSKDLLAATLEHIDPGVSVVDKDLRLVAWNRRYVEIFDYPPGFVRVGQPVDDLIRYNAMRGECGPGEVDALVARRMMHMRRAQPHTFERVRPGGTIIKTVGGPMPDGGYVMCFTDVTLERRAQQALEAARDELEARVTERTRAFMEANRDLAREADRTRQLAAELRLAQQASDAANRDKTRFLAAASHDLQQPLHAARLLCGALGAQVDDKGQALTRKIDAAIGAADRLLKSLLDISRLDAGGIQPKPSAWRIGELFEELEAEFAPLAAERGLSLRVRSRPVAVYTDRVLLRSILQNFLSNALRYTRAGGVLLACRVRGDKVRLEVWDSGPGIPEDMHGAIFEEFRRLPTFSRTEQGAGLGLAIVQRIARLLDADLGLSSRLKRGSRFWVSLPLHVQLHSSHRMTPPLAHSAELQNLQVLCVDNEPAILEAMDSLLSAVGCRVITASSRAAALGIVKSEVIDAALVDYRLDGGETGIEILQQLRDAYPKAVLALVTADPQVQALPLLKDLGVTVLAKPLAAEALVALLQAGVAQAVKTVTSRAPAPAE